MTYFVFGVVLLFRLAYLVSFVFPQGENVVQIYADIVYDKYEL